MTTRVNRSRAAINIHGPQGNAFGIMSEVRKIMQSAGRDQKEIREAMTSMTLSHSYEGLCDRAVELCDGALILTGRR